MQWRTKRFFKAMVNTLIIILDQSKQTRNEKNMGFRNYEGV